MGARSNIEVAIYQMWVVEKKVKAKQGKTQEVLNHTALANVRWRQRWKR